VQLELGADRRRIAAIETVDRKLLLFREANVAVALVLRPAELVDALDTLQERADPLKSVGQLDRDGIQVNSTALLEVGELGDLEPIEQDLPTDPPGAQGRRLPVVFLKPNIVLLEIDSDRAEALQVNVLYVHRRRLEDDLKL